ADRGGSAVHVKAVSRQAFLKEHADAFFVVEHENRAAAENARIDRANGGRKRGRRAVETRLRLCGRRLSGRLRGIFFDRQRKKNRESGASNRKRFDVDGPAVLANNCSA